MNHISEYLWCTACHFYNNSKLAGSSLTFRSIFLVNYTLFVGKKKKKKKGLWAVLWFGLNIRSHFWSCSQVSLAFSIIVMYPQFFTCYVAFLKFLSVSAYWSRLITIVVPNSWKNLAAIHFMSKSSARLAWHFYGRWLDNLLYIHSTF